MEYCDLCAFGQSDLCCLYNRAILYQSAEYSREISINLASEGLYFLCQCSYELNIIFKTTRVVAYMRENALFFTKVTIFL